MLNHTSDTGSSYDLLAISSPMRSGAMVRVRGIVIKHFSVRISAMLMTFYFQGSIGYTFLTFFPFYLSFPISSYRSLSRFLFFLSVNLTLCLSSLSILPWSYSLFRLFLSLPCPFSIHPSSLLFDRACVLFLSE